jgi:hypothetical protein
MMRTVQFIAFLLALAPHGIVCAQNMQSSLPPTNLPPIVQHFGPLVIVAFDKASSDPVTIRQQFFSDKKEDRLNAMRAMGVESSPDLYALWSAFLAAHANEPDDKGVMQVTSGGETPYSFGDPGLKQVVMEAGFDEASGHPLVFDAVYERSRSGWKHMATIACLCQWMDREVPVLLRPYLPHPPGEWAITLWSHTEGDEESHRREIRFKLRSGRLWPLIDFESMFTTCPQGSSYGPDCKILKTELEATKLIDEKKELVKGYTLVSWSGSPPSCDKCALLLYHPQCTSYLWDEAAFAYVPSLLKPVACGGPSKPTSSPHSQTPHSAKLSLHK